MNTLCDPHNSITQIKFQPLGKKIVEARFNGGTITSDAGALLLREVASAHSLFEDFSCCFVDTRDQRYTEHTVQELVAQRVYGICLGYEDLNDHDRLRLDPLLATVCGKEDAEGESRRVERDRGKGLAGKSTLHRLESAEDVVGSSERYKKIAYDGGAIERYFVDVFLKTHGEKPQEIILDVDATDDPIHGEQGGRGFSMGTMTATAICPCTFFAGMSFYVRS